MKFDIMGGSRLILGDRSIMPWQPLAALAVIGALVSIYFVFQHKRELKTVKTYRGKYIQLVAQLENITYGVNQLAPYVPQVKEEKILDYYESSMRMLETLLLAMKKIPPFGYDASVLNSAFYLVKDLTKRLERIKVAFGDDLKKKNVDLDKLYARAKKKIDLGCYFCSRPAMGSGFAKVKVKIEGKPKEVLSCRVCRAELKASKKVKVLYIVKDGKTLHWSESHEYSPSEDYWNINKRENKAKARKLELIVSRVEPISTHKNIDPK